VARKKSRPLRVVHGYHEEDRKRAVAAETGTPAASAQEETVVSGTRSGAPGQASGGAEQGRRIRTGRRTAGNDDGVDYTTTSRPIPLLYRHYNYWFRYILVFFFLVGFLFFSSFLENALYAVLVRVSEPSDASGADGGPSVRSVPQSQPVRRRRRQGRRGRVDVVQTSRRRR